MRVSLIVAMSSNHVIGRDGDLPWRLSADLKRFKALTSGHHIIMGRKTFESIGRLLPGRTSIVLTRQAGFEAAGALVAYGLEAALELAAADDEVFIIGGAEIYRQALPIVDRIYLTEVCTDVDGDTRFPDFNEREWSTVKESQHPADERNEFDHKFSVLDRSQQPMFPASNTE
jgi:dihydrofolate reductase